MQQTQKLRVSVIIPAYNEEEHLEACLSSLAHQTVQPDQVIVVDNNSSDQTAVIAQRFPFVTVISEHQQGRAYARNAGFAVARGDIIARTDADMVLPRNWVAHIKDFYADPSHAKFAWTCPGFFYNVRLPRFSNRVLRSFGFGLNRRLLGHDTLWGSSMALLRSQWQSVSSEVCNRADVHEDLDLAIHLARHNFQVYLDHTMEIRATLRRLNTDRAALWGYLCMWPRTLRLNHCRSWPLVYSSVIAMRFIFVPVHVVIDRLARWCGRPPLVG